MVTAAECDARFQPGAYDTDGENLYECEGLIDATIPVPGTNARRQVVCVVILNSRSGERLPVLVGWAERNLKLVREAPHAPDFYVV